MQHQYCHTTLCQECPIVPPVKKVHEFHQQHISSFAPGLCEVGYRRVFCKLSHQESDPGCTGVYPLCCCYHSQPRLSTLSSLVAFLCCHSNTQCLAAFLSHTRVDRGEELEEIDGERWRCVGEGIRVASAMFQRQRQQSKCFFPPTGVRFPSIIPLPLADHMPPSVSGGPSSPRQRPRQFMDSQYDQSQHKFTHRHARGRLSVRRHTAASSFWILEAAESIFPRRQELSLAVVSAFDAQQRRPGTKIAD